MLSMQVNNDSLFAEQAAQSVIDVARPVPTLVPVAYVQEEGEGIYSRSAAEFYYAPDEQTIIRLPSGDKPLTYDYDRATQIPETHPVWTALKDPARDAHKEIVIHQSREGSIGKSANPRDVSWLKGILDPQLKRQYEELKAKGMTL